MNDAMHRGEPVVALDQDNARKRRRRRTTTFCSVCDNRIWFGPIHITEPEGVPEPRLSWVLCKECHGLLLAEVRRSPVRSPLRLRIAMGLLASERWPHAYPSTERQSMSDHRWIVFIGLSIFIAMVLHLILIVLIAGIK